MAAYRHYHLTHHRVTQTKKDPDLALSSKLPISHASLRRKFTRVLTGRTGVKQLAGQILMSFRLAGDQDAIEAAALDFVQDFKAQDLWKPLPVCVGIIWRWRWLATGGGGWRSGCCPI